MNIQRCGTAADEAIGRLDALAEAGRRIAALEAMVVAANMSLMECAIAAHQKDADRAFDRACKGIDLIRKSNERAAQ